jgi:hypothetical protein
VAVTVSLYNHTAKLFADGSFAAGDTYKVTLYSAFSFDATDTTKALAESGSTQLATANGYTQDSKTLTGVAVTTVTTNDAKFDADDVTWTASGGSIAAIGALVYNDTDTNDPPVAYIDFGGTETASAGADLQLIWNASGIFAWTVA